MQDNESLSSRNVLRGLHYQIKQPQGKLVRVIVGEIYDVAVDLRRSSPTFGKWTGAILSPSQQPMIWIPQGFAHGFLVLSEQAIVSYKTTDYYAPEHERTLAWNDRGIGVLWPLEGEPLMSDKDRRGVAARRGRDLRLKILLTGRNGQVGWELERALAPLGEVVATDRSTLDLTNEDQIRSAVRAVKPDVIVNAAAYTAVDKAESEPELAMRINGFAPGVLADEAKRLGALLVHYSTDYVFDGEKTTPYVEEDEPNPINVYGKSKLAGERAVDASGCRHLLLRTSWVYSLRGSNFLLTVLRLARRDPAIRIVTDQRGTPTSAALAARATAHALRGSARGGKAGLFHLAARGVANRREFAAEAVRVAGLSCRVEPALTVEFPAPARRPGFSALASASFESAFSPALPDWRDDLARCMAQKDAG